MKKKVKKADKIVKHMDAKEDKKLFGAMMKNAIKKAKKGK